LFEDDSHNQLCQLLFAANRSGDYRTFAVDYFDLVIGRVDRRDSIDDHQVAEFSLQFADRLESRIFCLQGKSHGPLVGAFLFAKRRHDVGRLDEFEQQRFAGLF